MSKLCWTKAGRTVHEDGGTTVTYKAEGSPIVIESRKRPIPHAARGGCWMHTTYFCIFPDGTEKERWRLQDAKEIAEEEWKPNEREGGRS